MKRILIAAAACVLLSLLAALLIPHEQERKLQEENRMTELMILQEELKTYPMGDVWDEYCRRCGAGRLLL